MSTPLRPVLNLVSKNPFHVLTVEEIQDTPLSETKLVLQPKPTTTTPILDPKPILHESIGYNALEEDTRKKLDIKIMLKTVDMGQAVSVKALLDSGATGLFLDDNFVKHMGWKVDNIEQAVPVYNVDGTLNAAGRIRQTVDLFIHYGEHQERATFSITKLGGVKAYIRTFMVEMS